MFVLDAIKKYAETDRKALIHRDQALSYTALDRWSDAFAAYLLERYGESRKPVVIYGHKELWILPLVYGALKAGRAYVPVDITVPADRVGQILADVEPDLFVDFYRLDTGFGGEILAGEALPERMEPYMGRAVDRSAWVKPADIAYILFTSGSTGKPKGVPIEVRNIENLHRELAPWMETSGDGGVILNQISYSFDVSVVSIYMGIARGMTLHTIDKDMVANLGELFAELGRSGLCFWVSTPSFAELCVPSEKFRRALMPGLEKFLFCGEVLTHKLVDELMERFPETKIINTYGPTEATVLVTASEITPEMARDPRPIPIGAPLSEVRFRIVDEAGKDVPPGGEGELLIISDNVGPGYYGRPDLTEKVFFADPSGKRGYHTGDKCYESGGLYYYCGRLDNQIKVSGHRVEIEDIENNLAKVDNIARAAVLPVFEGEKVQSLAAFVLLQKPDGLGSLARAKRIKEQLGATLPGYMIPRKITAVEQFPLNTNGKVDKKELRKML